MTDVVSAFEEELNSFCPKTRREALDKVLEKTRQGDLVFPDARGVVNLHCHTFFSYNGYGYSPTYLAARARTEGLYAAGVVDFDVLEACEEFLEAARLLGLRAVAGVETRIFVPDFADRVINSPGEPGVAYHMGLGFVSGKAPKADMLAAMKEGAQDRNKAIMQLVNPYLSPVEVDYEKDLLPLAPKGNPTERHLCAAYQQKAEEAFPEVDARIAFWSAKLGVEREDIAKIIDNAPKLQGLIRAKTMKSGGPGYIEADPKSFPLMRDFNEFVLSAGAIPTCAWLDGTSDGEKAMDELLDLQMAAGVAAFNIIPDRNWNIDDPDIKKVKVKNLYDVVERCKERGLPIAVGTEMNAFGQKFVDDFAAPELDPLTDVFLDGARIFYAHTILHAGCGMGYLSDWAQQRFSSVHEKNDFFNRIGEAVAPGSQQVLGTIGPDQSPAEILQAVNA